MSWKWLDCWWIILLQFTRDILDRIRSRKIRTQKGVNSRKVNKNSKPNKKFLDFLSFLFHVGLAVFFSTKSSAPKEGLIFHFLLQVLYNSCDGRYVTKWSRFYSEVAMNFNWSQHFQIKIFFFILLATHNIVESEEGNVKFSYLEILVVLVHLICIIYVRTVNLLWWRREKKFIEMWKMAVALSFSSSSHLTDKFQFRRLENGE